MIIVMKHFVNEYCNIYKKQSVLSVSSIYFLIFKHVGRTWSSLFEPRNDLTNRDELAILDFGGSKGLKTLTLYSVKYLHSEDLLK